MKHLKVTISILAIILSSCSEKSSDVSKHEDFPAPIENKSPAKNTPAPLTFVAADQPVSFNEHIQPILSAACYHCHGPDSGTREPKDNPLRIDQAKFALEKRENGKPVIIPGDPDNSLLMQLMESKNPEEVMPIHPSRSPHGSILAPEKIALVRRWIQEGAKYEAHWAYLAPRKAPLPTINHPEWAKNPIDDFIAKKLENANLEPNQEEDKARLLRRVTLDVTGLLPTPEETDKFVADTRPFDTVYSEKVDQLLSTDAYAEQFARHWLDVARYADTHGIHIDNYRSIWPYRDWVINAFRANMPFDQFTVEQIAGDMLPNPTTDQIVATGFHRCLPTTGEGGAIAEEYAAIYAQDRADTTASAYLGLTVGCAACHDHKFDAISTKENYQLTAFFRNTTMSSLDRNSATHPPTITLFDENDQTRLDAITSEVAATKKAITDTRTSTQPAFQAWLKKANVNPTLSIDPQSLAIHLPLNEKTKGITDAKGNTFPAEKPINWVSDDQGEAVLFTGNNSIDLGQNGNIERDQPFTIAAWIKAPHDLNGAIIAKMHSPGTHQGYDLWLQNGHLTTHLIHNYPQDFLKTRTKSKFPNNEWFHAIVTYDGSSQAAGLKFYINGKPQQTIIDENKLTNTIRTTVPLRLGRREGGQAATNTQLFDFRLYSTEMNVQDALALASTGRIDKLRSLVKKSPAQLKQLESFYFTTVDKKSIQLTQTITKLEAERAQIQKRATPSLIMKEKAKSEPFAHILTRGVYSDKGEKVFPGTPASLPPMTKDQPKNRLGLAKWIVDPRNPLPARITVNRYWGYFFGNAIVESTNDFGIMGARPSHPKLLDWLAIDFVESKWDLHHLVKTIVSSATYRQNANISPEKLEADPLNKLVSRGPRYRLDAEQIRDLALQSSGLLSPKIGGPSVKPPQPKNIWSAVAMPQSNTRDYKTDTGDKIYRRSLYTFWKRTAINPAMEIFNAPTREISCTRRDITNTPLQAFVLMNETQFVESSRELAEKALLAKKETRERIDFIAKTLLSRNMNTQEAAIIENTLNFATKKFKADPAGAKKLISVGASTPDEKLNPTELAAWTLVTNQILNMDETLNK